MIKGKINNMRNSLNKILTKNILILLVMISMCPLLGISYARFVIITDNYRSSEMYISELLYSIKIDSENKYTLNVPSGESEHVIEITSVDAIGSNYKLLYKNNSNIIIEYASDYNDPAFGGILTTKTIMLKITNTSTSTQTVSFSVAGGYSFNSVEDVIVPEGYTEIKADYWKYDYETTALYVNNTRVESLDENKNYKLNSYTCSNNAVASYDTSIRTIMIKSDNQTKCSLYFEELNSFADYLINNYEKNNMIKISQVATGNQNYDTVEYRYQGASPSNYITFNNETNVWRIVGVFEVMTYNKTDETDTNDINFTKEYRVKIVRDLLADEQPWNGTTKSERNKAAWDVADLKIYLNTTYYNSLTDDAKNKIDSTKWYLGNVDINANLNNMYISERSSTVHSGNPETLNTNIGLLNPSDYMYASSGCYVASTNSSTITGYNYSDTTCTSTNYLYYSDDYWFINPTTSTTPAAALQDGGRVSNFYSEVAYNHGVRPALYLSFTTEYVSGDGSTSNPYIIK